MVPGDFVSILMRFLPETALLQEPKTEGVSRKRLGMLITSQHVTDKSCLCWQGCREGAQGHVHAWTVVILSTVEPFEGEQFLPGNAAHPNCGRIGSRNS